MAHPIRKNFWVMAITWTGLRKRVLEIRTALVMELDGRRARYIARQLGGHFLKEVSNEAPVLRDRGRRTAKCCKL